MVGLSVNGMFASQHPIRIGRTQIGLLPLVASFSQLMVASQHPFRIGRTQSPLKTSTELMFLLFQTYPLNQASLIRVYA